MRAKVSSRVEEGGYLSNRRARNQAFLQDDSFRHGRSGEPPESYREKNVDKNEI